jgi:hypothetical protein
MLENDHKASLITGALVYINRPVRPEITSANKHRSTTSGLLQVSIFPTALSAGMKWLVFGLLKEATITPSSSCSAMTSIKSSS